MQSLGLAKENRPSVISIDELQPSQLYISAGKLKKMLLAPHNVLNSPIPVKRLDGEVVMTDGHTRAYILWTCGSRELRVVWDEDELDWDAYRTCVGWCKEEGITSVSRLQSRVVTEEEFQKYWIDRCREMHE